METNGGDTGRGRSSGGMSRGSAPSGRSSGGFSTSSSGERNAGGFSGGGRSTGDSKQSTDKSSSSKSSSSRSSGGSATKSRSSGGGGFGGRSSDRKKADQNAQQEISVKVIDNKPSQSNDEVKFQSVTYTKAPQASSYSAEKTSTKIKAPTASSYSSNERGSGKSSYTDSNSVQELKNEEAFTPKASVARNEISNNKVQTVTVRIKNDSNADSDETSQSGFRYGCLAVTIVIIIAIMIAGWVSDWMTLSSRNRALPDLGGNVVSTPKPKEDKPLEPKKEEVIVTQPEQEKVITVKPLQNQVNMTEWYQDPLSWIVNGQELIDGLTRFYEKTGVQPYVAVVPYDSSFWEEDGAANTVAMDSYLDEIYGNTFTDEAHFLFAYFAWQEDSAVKLNGEFRYLWGFSADAVMNAEVLDILVESFEKEFEDEQITIDILIANMFKNTADQIITDTGE